MPERLAMATTLLCAVASARGAADDWKAQEYAVDAGDLKTPTTRWLGERYAQGRLAVLVFQSEHIHEQDCRQPMELARAFGFDVEYVHAPYGGKLEIDHDRAREMLDGRRWDAIVFWSTESWHNDYARCADDVKFRILRQVADGAGIVFTNRAPKEVCRKDRAVPVPVGALAGGIGFTGRAARDAAYWKAYWKSDAPLDEASFVKKHFAAYRIGKGLAIDLSGIAVTQDGRWTHHEAVPWRLDHRIDHQYMLAEVGRAILCAAGRPPRVEIVRSPPARWELPLGQTKGKPATWALKVADAPRGGDNVVVPTSPRPLTLSWRLRDLRGTIIASGEGQRVSARGEADVSATLPDLGSGHYYLDVFVDGPDGRETYGYTSVVVPAACTVSVEPKSVGVEPGDPYEGTVTVTRVGKREEGAREGRARLDVEVRLVDWEDRVVSRTTRSIEPGGEVGTTTLSPPRGEVGTTTLSPPRGEVGTTTLSPPRGSFDYSFPSDPHDSIRMHVEAVARAGDRVVGTGSAAHNLLKRRHDRFNVLLWGSIRGPYAHWGKRKLWRTGVTVSMSGGMEVGNMAYAPFIAAWGAWSGQMDGEKFTYDLRSQVNPKPDKEMGLPLQKPYAWNDPRFDRVIALQDRHWQKGRTTPVFTYNLYDEGPHAGCDLSESGLAAYRAWLKGQYGGDLAGLNEEWQSAYTTWDEVTVLNKGDNYEKKARDQGIYARWSDRKLWAEVNFARNVLGALQTRARTIDPHARVGFEGSGGFGMALDELLANAGFWCPYDGVQTEMVRSLKPDGFIHAYWIGYQKNADALIARAWRMVINDAPSIWWWMLKGRGRFHGWLAPNNVPYPENQAFLDEVILPLRRGLGDLIVRLAPRHDGIALYYSAAASHAGEIGECAQFNSVSGAHANFVRLIEDCGFQWIYTTKRRVLDGDLARRGVKLLILPFQQPLGRDEVDALTSFVRSGGTVLADLRPGVLSGHCRPVAHGPADRLFGIERTGPGKPVPVSGRFVARLKAASVPFSLRNNRADGDIRPTTATAGATADGHGVFLVNKVGTGMAVLLNFHLTQYNGEREMTRGDEKRRFFKAFVSGVGISPRLVRSHIRGGELLRTETVTWSKGGVTLYALYRDGGDSAPAEVILPGPAHVFDLRTGGTRETTTVRIDELRPGYAHFLATYPYDPGVPHVVADRAEASGGQTVDFTIRMSGAPPDEAGIFSYHTRLIDPAGRWVDVIPWSVQGDGRGARTHVRFAHNDPAGDWTLHVREVTTGRTASATVRLK